METPDILQCDKDLLFWISWRAGLIRAGRGNVQDEQLILEWRDPEPIGIGILAISTGFGATGNWEFANLMGKIISVFIGGAALSQTIYLE